MPGSLLPGASVPIATVRGLGSELEVWVVNLRPGWPSVYGLRPVFAVGRRIMPPTKLKTYIQTGRWLLQTATTTSVNCCWL
jgi:hypothetical protein